MVPKSCIKWGLVCTTNLPGLSWKRSLILLPQHNSVAELGHLERCLNVWMSTCGFGSPMSSLSCHVLLVLQSFEVEMEADNPLGYSPWLKALSRSPLRPHLPTYGHRLGFHHDRGYKRVKACNMDATPHWWVIGWNLKSCYMSSTMCLASGRV